MMMMMTATIIHKPTTGRDTTTTSTTEDVSQAMAEEVDRLALLQMTATPGSIWEEIREEFTFSGVTRGLTREQVISRVYRTRNRYFGSSIYGQVEVPPLSQARDGSSFFLQFHFTYAGNEKTEHVLGWGHRALIRLLNYTDVSLFVDGTFHCVPFPFYQCVIVMVYDRGSKCYVPVMYVLAMCKTEWTYWHIFHCVQVATGLNMEPSTITCDFEQGLINAIRDQFPESAVVGCLFHFKQAIRRRMQKLHIPPAEISCAMARGVIDVLAVLPHEQLDPLGIDYVQTLIQDSLTQRGVAYSEDKWVTFWVYFRRTWLEMYPPELWNVWGITRRIINRTNNPLERYNRELNAEFPTHTPNIPTFVGVIERHAHHYVGLLEDIARGRARAPPHGTYCIPNEFTL